MAGMHFTALGPSQPSAEMPPITEEEGRRVVPFDTLQDVAAEAKEAHDRPSWRGENHPLR
jgi:hypothetical protein